MGEAPTLAPLLSGEFEFTISLVPDHLLTSSEPIGWSDVADGAVQAFSVVVVEEGVEPDLGFGLGGRREAADDFGLGRAMKALDLAVRLRVRGRCAHVAHPCDSDEGLEVLGDEG